MEYALLNMISGAHSCSDLLQECEQFLTPLNNHKSQKTSALVNRARKESTANGKARKGSMFAFSAGQRRHQLSRHDRDDKELLVENPDVVNNRCVFSLGFS